MPAEKYTWQATPEVRSFARLFAHIVDDNNGACAAMAGVTPAPARLDTGSATDGWAANKMPKADLEKALADSVALCNKAFAAVDQTNMMEMQGRRTKIGALIYNTSHINEHYGNLVTYLRLNGMVPPSSAPRGAGELGNLGSKEIGKLGTGDYLRAVAGSTRDARQPGRSHPATTATVNTKGGDGDGTSDGHLIESDHE
ncbi:MAG: DinB family protein [Acidobacteria bacterium]|nr:DinB family protein [Acidobacteriota bacterium]